MLAASSGSVYQTTCSFESKENGQALRGFVPALTFVVFVSLVVPLSSTQVTVRSVLPTKTGVSTRSLAGISKLVP